MAKKIKRIKVEQIKLVNCFMIKDSYLEMTLSSPSDRNKYSTKHLLLILLSKYTNTSKNEMTLEGYKDTEKSSLGGQCQIGVDSLISILQLKSGNKGLIKQLDKLKEKGLITYNIEKDVISYEFLVELIPNFSEQKELYTWIPRDLVYRNIKESIKDKFLSKHVLLCVAILKYERKKKITNTRKPYVRASLNQLGSILEINCSNSRNTINGIINECIEMGILIRISGGFVEGMANVKEMSRYKVRIERLDLGTNNIK